MTAFSPSPTSLDGVLLVDKPSGPTSHDVVRDIRKIFRIGKVGHGGTLDPNATGLLVILFTRRLRRGLEKQIDNLAAELVERKLAGGLFPELQQLCDETARQRDRLEQLGERAEELRREIAGPAQLGVSRPPLETSAR